MDAIVKVIIYLPKGFFILKNYILNLVKNIQTVAKETLLIEARAIERLIDFIDDDFEKCVEAIFACKGRVVVTGIGKSANIGNKIVSTFNSTGTPSLFMHAADAIHGDLGMVQENDVVICISNSGNTPEVKFLVPLVKKLGAKIVAMVGNISSYLAENADFVINTSIEREADPNNLAPTCSTTATLAMGDALAVSLISKRDFKAKDFAKYHPGGALGKKLYLTLDDFIISSNYPKVTMQSSLSDVILEISSKRMGATAVLENEHLKGIITDGDLRRMLKKGVAVHDLQAKDIMSLAPKTIDISEYAVKALKVLRENSISQIIVTDASGNYKGMVHIHDLLKEGIF